MGTADTTADAAHQMSDVSTPDLDTASRSRANKPGSKRLANVSASKTFSTTRGLRSPKDNEEILRKVTINGPTKSFLNASHMWCLVTRTHNLEMQVFATLLPLNGAAPMRQSLAAAAPRNFARARARRIDRADGAPAPPARASRRSAGARAGRARAIPPAASRMRRMPWRRGEGGAAP